jgi:hypothetical protein
MQDGWTPFHFFEIPFPAGAWRLALAGGALLLALAGLAARRRSKPHARLMWALALALVGAEAVRTACAWAFEPDSWAGFQCLLGACALGGAFLGFAAAGRDLPPDGAGGQPPPPAGKGKPGPPASSEEEEALAWLKLNQDGQA